MSRNHDEQAIAIAAMFQAASLVDQIANKGMMSQSSFEVSINSLFQTSPENTEQIFGGQQQLANNLNLGFKALLDTVLKRKKAQSVNITNYVLSMIMLQQKLANNDQMLSMMSDRIEGLASKAEKFYSVDIDNPAADINLTHTNIIAGLDGLYQDTISTFSFRIKVQGDPRHLQNKENAAKVRALLLAGVRAAILWRQVGGKRWQLLFFKAKIRESVEKILAAANH